MHRPLRVLWVLDTAVRNRLLAAVADAAPPGGLELAVATLGDSGPLREQADARGIDVHALGVGDSRNLAHTVPRLRAVIERVQPDLLHPHLLWSAVSTELARTLRRPRVPMVLGRHHDLNHHLKGKTLHSRIDRWVARRADRVIAVSDAVRRTMIEREGADSSKIDVVHNGLASGELAVSDDAVARWKDELGAGRWLVAAGRLDWQKDYPTLVRAFASARRRLPDLRLAIAGTGGDDVRAQIVDVAASLGVSDDVRLLGWVDDALALFLAGDLFVQASVTEACPQTVMEAASLGVPMAVTDAGGTLEIVGAFHPRIATSDVDGLADRIVALLADLPAARRDAERGSIAVRDHFNAARMAAEHLAVYRDVLGLTGGAR